MSPKAQRNLRVLSDAMHSKAGGQREAAKRASGRLWGAWWRGYFRRSSSHLSLTAIPLILAAFWRIRPMVSSYDQNDKVAWTHLQVCIEKVERWKSEKETRVVMVIERKKAQNETQES